MVLRLRLFGTLIVLIVLLAACGGGDDDADPTATTPAESSTTTSEASSASSPETQPTQDQSAEASATSSIPAGTPTITPVTGVRATATPNTPDDLVNSNFAFGWNVALRGDDQADDFNQQVVDSVKDSGFGWVRFQISWSEFERQNGQWDPLPYDRMIDKLSSEGLNILVVVAKAPEWAQRPDDNVFLNNPAEFEQFMAFVSERYAGKVQAWEIWNEQNLASEFGGHVDVGQYVGLLEAGSQGVRAGDPDALVVFGGLTPNGVMDFGIAVDDYNFLNLAYAYNGGEIKDYFDVLGVHLNSTHNSPDNTFPDNVGENKGWNDHPSFFFRRAEQLRQVMVENGDMDKPIWITEFGWTTANQAPGYEYGVDNTEQEVADYLSRSLEIATTEWPWVTGAFVWNLNWSTVTDPADEKYPWSALNGDWSPRPAYEALKQFPKDRAGS